MKNRVVRYSIIVFSIVFALRVITIFTADRLYSMALEVEEWAGPPAAAITMLKIATMLDSTNTDLYFLKYEVLQLEQKNDVRKQQIHLLKKCINLCPSWPAYHVYYAFMIKQMSPSPNIVTKDFILSEFKQATELKPYSPMYKKLYQKHLNRY
jgi:hypothetical protein